MKKNLPFPTAQPKQLLWALCCLLLLLSMFTACDKDRIYDKFAEIPQAQWTYEQKMPFEVEITDTIQHYNVYINVRHNDTYPYSNLWVMLYTWFPSGKKIENRVNLPLANKEGRWYGNKGLNSLITNQVLIQENAQMPEIGTYKFEIVQDMRSNPLNGITETGIRVERANIIQ